MHLSAAALADFYRQLATYLDAGMSIIRALDTLSSKRGAAARAARGLSQRIGRGMALTDAMVESGSFPELHTQLIDAGEKSGRLPAILRNLAEALDKARELRNQLIVSLIYPLLVFHAGVLVMSIVKSVLHQTAHGPVVESKPLVGLVFALTCLLPPYGIALACYILVRIGRTVKPIGYILSAIALAVPVFGRIRRHMAMARFFRSMHSLYVAGVNTAEALRISAKTCGNHVLTQRLLPASDVVNKGDSVAAALDAMSVLTVDESAMIATGCESGRLDDMLLRIAVELEGKAHRAARLAARVVPFIAMLAVGGMIIYFIIALMGSYLSTINSLLD